MPVRTSLPRLLAASVLVLATASSASSCGANVSVSLTDPLEVRDQSAWLELDIFENDCPPVGDIAAAAYPDPFKRLVVQASEDLPPIGNLPAKPYGFLAILRDESCGIKAFACVKANLEKVREIKININNPGDEPPVGTCSGTETCVEGQCSQEGEGGAGGEGGSPATLANECAKEKSGSSGCKLEVFGFGDLPTASPGSKLGSPVVIAAGKSFVVAYHEMLSDGSQRVVSSLGVGADGCYQGAISQLAVAECAGKANASFDPALAGAWNTSSGHGSLSFTRSRCSPDRGVGVGFGSFGANGSLTALVGSDSENKDPRMALLFSPQAIVSASQADTYRMLYLADGSPQMLDFTNVEGEIAYPTAAMPNPFGSLSDVFLFSAHTTSGTRVAEVVGNSTKSTLHLSTGGEPIFADLPGAKDMRLRFTSDGLVTAFRTASGDGINWAAYDTTGVKQFPADETTSKSLTTGSPGYDMTTLDDKVIFVTGASNGFNLQLFKTDTFASFKSLAFEASNFSALDGFDGKQIAVGATSGRIAVAWVTSQPKAGKPVGGVAVLKCE